MAHPQNSPRGLFAKNGVYIGAQQLTNDGTNLVLNNGIKVSNQANAAISGNSTGLVIAGGVKLNSARTIQANSTGLSITAETAKPTTRDAGYNWTFLTNTTGVSSILVRTTGTTWKYLNVTTLLPT